MVTNYAAMVAQRDQHTSAPAKSFTCRWHETSQLKETETNTNSLFSFLVISVICDSTLCLLNLLLLAELFVHTSSRPTSSPSLCGMFGSMIHQVDRLKNLSKKLHGLVRFHCHTKIIPGLKFPMKVSIFVIFTVAPCGNSHVGWKKANLDVSDSQ